MRAENQSATTGKIELKKSGTGNGTRIVRRDRAKAERGVKMTRGIHRGQRVEPHEAMPGATSLLNYGLC
jgi:hypothetical protein